MIRLIAATLAVTVFGVVVHSTQAQEPTPEATPVREELRLGDVDCDGRINALDATLILQLDVGFLISDLCVEAGDINDDGTLNTIDAALVLQATAGLTSFPPVPPDPLPPPASGGIKVGSAEAAPGGEATVALEAYGVTDPGLGAWTIDVGYDPAVVSVVRCRAELGAVCNSEFASGVVRLSGASAGGKEGDTKLADLTVTCTAVGQVSDLNLNPRVFADGTRGGPQPINPTVTHGSITCAGPDLIVIVIHDLDADGVLDPGEPGLEGWSIDVSPGCIDAFFTLEATDDAGRTSGQLFGQKVCVNVRQVGWVLTSGSRSVNVEPGSTVEAIFLFRKVGQEYFRLAGDLIVNGLPATDSVALDALVGERSCGDAQIGFGAARTGYSLYVLGEADRSGCANEGQEFTVTIDGEIVHQASFTSNPWTNSERIDLILGPTPMWFFGSGRDGTAPVPFVGSVVCGEAREIIGSFVPDYYEIYVFPDALRSGCGAPGRIVTLQVGGEVLQHVAWQGGFVEGYLLEVVELPVVGARETSDVLKGGQRRAILLAMAGLVLLGGGVAGRRAGRAG